MAILHLTFWGRATFYIPISDVWVLEVLWVLPNTCTFHFLNYRHFSRCELLSSKVVLICSFLMTAFRQLFTGLSSSTKCLFNSFAHFLIGLSFCCWIGGVLYIFWMLNSLNLIFSPTLRTIFSDSWKCPLMHKSFKFWWSPIYLFILCSLYFGDISKTSLINPR